MFFNDIKSHFIYLGLGQLSIKKAKTVKKKSV